MESRQKTQTYTCPAVEQTLELEPENKGSEPGVGQPLGSQHQSKAGA